ncbi:sugar acetyltransferase [Sphingobacteriaceae bacterium]|nr:sugar acetyltransferase [Sphingobacteriaceae bacterium]
MVFSSITFLVYFLPFVILLYHFVGKRFKNTFLLIASIVFYAWGAPRFIFVILGTTLLDFFLVSVMDNSHSERRRKLMMIFSICMNLGLLFYFKYCNFFVENINAVFSLVGVEPIKMLEIVLPIGISFYTFESLTYVIDVYRRVHKPLKNFWHYQLYIILFPKLIAGPIIRYHEIADQITDRSAQETVDNRLAGFFRFVIGLSKKVFIANTMAVFADSTFNVPADTLTAATAWTGMLAYTFQIYFDFSGYSDMAIGLAKIFGFRFPENFDNPYTSQSITEFWRRWHITLGSWMKNYLYIPLGGNKVSKARMYFNLWLVFLASGFWHGASWTFIIWGIYHGTFLVLERLFLLEFYKKIGKIPSTAFTFLLVAIGWVFFRADSASSAIGILTKLFSVNYTLPIGYYTNQFIFYFGLAAVFSFFTLVKGAEKLQIKIFEPRAALGGTLIYTVTACILFTVAVASIASSSFNPFIYFRF